MQSLGETIEDIGTKLRQREAGLTALPASTISSPQKRGGQPVAVATPNQPSRSTRSKRQPTNPQTTTTVCPQCKGAGWLRTDAEVGSPNFGRIIACICKTREIEQHRQRSLMNMSNLDDFAALNFANYDANVTDVREAFTAARDFARHPEGWLLLSGGFGCGKTHLAAAIANETIARGVITYFAVTPDLLDQLRAAYAPSSELTYDERFERMRGTSLLVVDDLGTENATPWAREKLYQIFNHRYNLRMATVVTTNVDLGLIDPRISSRLRDEALCRIVEISAADYRLIPLSKRSIKK
jgi:DNA replication protein DnaC